MSSIVQRLFFLRCSSRLFGVLQGVVRDREFIRLRGRAETLLTTVLALVERSVIRLRRRVHVHLFLSHLLFLLILVGGWG